MIVNAAEEPDFSNALALLIGVSEFEHQTELSAAGLGQIEYAHADAALMRKTLLRLGFSRHNIRCLRNRNATLEAFKRNFDGWLAANAGGRTVLLFFATHGLDEPFLQDPRTYLLLYDAKVGTLHQTALETSDLAAGVQHLGAERTVIFLDACRSGPKRRGDLAPWRGEMYRALAAKASAFVAACQADQDSWEVAGHGLFTLRLAQALCGLGGAANGLVDVNQVITYVQAMVKLDAKKIYDEHKKPVKQEPFSICEGGGFPIGRDLSAYITKRLEKLVGNASSRELGLRAQELA